MKKVIAIFILLCVICSPTPTFSQDSLLDIIKQFQDTEKQLRYLSIDLLKISGASSSSERDIFYSGIANSIGSSADLISNAVDLNVLSQSIQEEEKYFIVSIYIPSRLSMLKKHIESEINSIQTSYAGINNQAALHLIDKAKDQMRAS
jgi:hypothetical protein